MVFSIGYALPLAIAPLAWARRIGWHVHPDPLTVYFGRCLGCVMLAVCVAAVRVARLPAARTAFLELLTLSFAAMIVVHLIGWLRRSQPRLETLELPVFFALTVIALWLRVAA
ncbi:MAG TPA: hypothetical protein VIV40_06020 [Kofleriaceae bacterium]